MPEGSGLLRVALRPHVALHGQHHSAPAATNTTAGAVHAVLVPGYWLGGWAWSSVEPARRDAGIQPHSLTLPGLDGAPTDSLTMNDRIDAVIATVTNLDGDIVLVGHSGGGPVVQGATDRAPDRIKRVIYVETGPLLDGITLHPDATDDIPLPSWDELSEQHASIEGIDADTLAEFRERSVPQPGGVAASPIQLSNDERLDVLATVICTSMPSAVLQQMIDQGQMPSELPALRHVDYLDLPTGHWPMFSRLDDLIPDQVLDPGS